MDITNLVELREEKGRLANEADQILVKAKEEGRSDLRDDEDKKFDAIHADIEKISKNITRLEKQEATRSSLNESQGRKTTHNDTDTRQQARTFGKITEHDRVEAFRAWALPGVPKMALATAWIMSMSKPSICPLSGLRKPK